MVILPPGSARGRLFCGDVVSNCLKPNVLDRSLVRGRDVWRSIRSVAWCASGACHRYTDFVGGGLYGKSTGDRRNTPIPVALSRSHDWVHELDRLCILDGFFLRLDHPTQSNRRREQISLRIYCDALALAQALFRWPGQRIVFVSNRHVYLLDCRRHHRCQRHRIQCVGRATRLKR